MRDITVSTEEGKVIIQCKASYPIANWTFSFAYGGHCEWQSKLLAKHLRDELHATVKAIRQQAYCLGCKDGRAKRKKKTCFSIRFAATERDIW